MKNEIRQSFTVIIVGGGPAGISAAMGFLEARIDCLLIDQGTELGGQVLDIPSYITNLPAGQFNNGNELGQALQTALSRAQELAALDNSKNPRSSAPGTGSGNGSSDHNPLLTIRQRCRVLDIQPGDDSVVVRTNLDTFIADYVLVATGYRVKMLEAPEGDRFTKHWHNNSDSLPKDLSQTSVAVVGGGDSALLKVLGLAPHVQQIHLIVRNSTLRGRPDLVKQTRVLENCHIHLGCEIVALEGDQSLKKLVLQNKESGAKKEIDASEVIVKVGYEPNTEVLQGKVQLNTSRHVVASAAVATSHPRIYAAGDIVNELHPRLASAIGQGMIAAGAIINKVFADAAIPADFLGEKERNQGVQDRDPFEGWSE